MAYVAYNSDSEVKELDLNHWDTSPKAIADGASGRHLYKNDPRHSAYYYCYGGRDHETHYIINKDRDNHPDHFSRFGYARCRNGYCSGAWPGRYNASEECSDYDPQPKDMAPARFYTEKYQGAFVARSQAYSDYSEMKNHGMNYPAMYAKC